MKYPKLYSKSADQFGVKIFWVWIINALVHSVLLFWIPMLAIHKDVIWYHGKEGGYLVFGNMVYTVSLYFIFIQFSSSINFVLKSNSVSQFVVMAVCLKAGLHTNSWTIITHFAIWGSVISWFAVMLIYRLAFCLGVNFFISFIEIISILCLVMSGPFFPSAW